MLLLTGLLAGAPALASGMEAVAVSQVLDASSKVVVTRSTGESLILEYGVGCLSIFGQVGQVVYVNSPGLFAGVGSEIVIPARSQSCRIWNSTSLGTGPATSAPSQSPPVPATPTDGPTGCTTGHWINEVSSNGAVILLEDGTAWSVAGHHQHRTAIWLPVTKVAVCREGLINLRKDQFVSASRMR